MIKYKYFTYTKDLFLFLNDNCITKEKVIYIGQDVTAQLFNSWHLIWEE